MTDRPIYLDYQATSPVDPRVVEAMLPYLTTEFGNPSSSHTYGRAAATAVEAPRDQLAALIGATDASEIVFTSSGTESNLLALTGAAHSLQAAGRGDHIIITTIEHPATRQPATDSPPADSASPACRLAPMAAWTPPTLLAPSSARGGLHPDHRPEVTAWRHSRRRRRGGLLPGPVLRLCRRGRPTAREEGCGRSRLEDGFPEWVEARLPLARRTTGS